MKLEEGVNKLVEELEQLKIKNRVLEILFEEVLECIVIVDTNGLVRMMNRSYAEFLGIKPERCSGKTCDRSYRKYSITHSNKNG